MQLVEALNGGLSLMDHGGKIICDFIHAIGSSAEEMKKLADLFKITI
jgi:hypothetical protein